MRTKTEYKDVVDVQELKSGRVVQAEILTYLPEKTLVVSINRQIKLSLNWVPHAKAYIGQAAGLEFTSDGPETITYRTNR